MKRISVLALGSLLGGASALAASYPVTVKDDLTSITVNQKPLRIVASHPISLELLLALGVQPTGYGTAQEGTRLGTPLKNIPKYSDLLKTEPAYVGNPLNFEAVAALKPDLIIGYNPKNADQERQIRRIAPALLFNYAEGDGWQRAIVPLGKVLGRERRAQEILATVTRQEQQAKILLAPTVNRGKTIAVFGIIGKDLYIFNTDFPPAQQLTRLGFQVVGTPSSGGKLNTISPETILSTKADRALLLSYSPQPQTQQTALDFMRRAGFKTVHTLEPESVARFTAGPLSDIQMLNAYVKVLSRKGIK